MGDDIRRCRGGFPARVVGWWPYGLAELSALPSQGGSPVRGGSLTVGGRAGEVGPWGDVLDVGLGVLLGRRLA